MKSLHIRHIIAAIILIQTSTLLSVEKRGFDSEDQGFVVTRWRDPFGQGPQKHKPLLIKSPLSMERCSKVHLTKKKQSLKSIGRICIVVENNLYNAISSKIDQYASDIEQDGYQVVIYKYITGSAEDLRSFLRDLYQESASLVGSIFIGNIPYIIYEMMQDWDGSGGDPPSYEDFPCDLFFMDLDGEWEDVIDNVDVESGNGKYDRRSGNMDLEIWMCRMRTDNLTDLGSEADILNKYFNKNHKFRTGELTVSGKGLVYVDDDWRYGASEDSASLSLIFQKSKITAVKDPERTTAIDFKKARLTADYELMLIRSHGYPGGHGFYRNNKQTFEFVYNTDYLYFDPAALFYSFFVCSGSDYTYNNYLAGLAIFNPEDLGLLSWGSTKTGGMLSDRYFYSSLSYGNTFGDAFKDWFNTVQYSPIAPRWWYGMVLIGDGSLSINTPPPSAPDNIIVKYESKKVKIYWSPNIEPDIYKYNIYRGMSPESLNLIDSVLATSHDTSYIDMNIINGQTYYYAISAVDSTGKESPPSDGIDVMPEPDNAPPVITQIPDTTLNEDEELTIPKSYFYQYIDDPNILDQQLLLYFSENDSISILLNNNACIFSPKKDWFGTDTITVIVSDGQLSDSTLWILKVNPVNDSPCFTDQVPDTILLNPGERYTLLLNELVSDIDDSLASLTWDCTVHPSSKLIHCDLDSVNSRIILWVEFNFSITMRINLKVSDGELTAEKQIAIIIENLSTPYTIEGVVPEKYVLMQNYPNPFNSVTNIFYGIPEESRVVIKIFDITGREVLTIVDKTQEAGYYNIPWYGHDKYGNNVPSGVYFYQITALSTGGKFQKSRKLIILK